jgi:hypothetical protein
MTPISVPVHTTANRVRARRYRRKADKITLDIEVSFTIRCRLRFRAGWCLGIAEPYHGDRR